MQADLQVLSKCGRLWAPLPPFKTKCETKAVKKVTPTSPRAVSQLDVILDLQASKKYLGHKFYQKFRTHLSLDDLVTLVPQFGIPANCGCDSYWIPPQNQHRLSILFDQSISKLGFVLKLFWLCSQHNSFLGGLRLTDKLIFLAETVIEEERVQLDVDKLRLFPDNTIQCIEWPFFSWVKIRIVQINCLVDFQSI